MLAAEPVQPSERRTALRVALLIWATCAFSAALLLYASARWWLPVQASAQAPEVDGVFKETLMAVSIPFIIVYTLLGWGVWRYAHRGQDSAGTTGPWSGEGRVRKVITLAVVFTFLVDAALVFLGGRVWIRLHAAPPPDALTVAVVAEQFGWRYHYPGPDGVLGRTVPALISNRNPLGLDPNDPASRDDIVTRELHLPVGQPVRLLIRSKDVLHSFFLPNMRFKQDAVPGRIIERWVTPTQAGRFTVACAELCGTGHYVMASAVVVEPPEQFRQWLRAQVPTWQLASAR